MAQATAVNRCTVERPDHTFCDGASIDGSPFPICVKHAAQIFRFLSDAVGADDLDYHGRMSVIDRIPQQMRGCEVVYYLRAGAHVKIGWTGNLRVRMYHYQPGVELIALEPGARTLEAMRHSQFAHLRVGGREWFLPGPDLKDHIAQVVAQHGAPA